MSQREATVASSAIPSTTESLRSLWHSRGLILALTQRELRGRYRASALGILWALFRPLVTLLIYAIVVGGFLGASASIPNFGVFLFVSLLAFNIFATCVQTGVSSITSNAALVKKVTFPREVLPIVAVLVALVNTAIQLPILIGAYLITQSWPSPGQLLILLPALAGLILLSLAVAIFLSALNVYSRDIEHLIDVILLVLFWASPVVYAWSFAVDFFRSHGYDWLATLYLYNPLTVCVIAFQDALWPAASTAQGAPFLLFDSPWDWKLWAIPLIALVLLWGAHRIFVHLQGSFAREL